MIRLPRPPRYFGGFWGMGILVNFLPPPRDHAASLQLPFAKHGAQQTGAAAGTATIGTACPPSLRLGGRGPFSPSSSGCWDWGCHSPPGGFASAAPLWLSLPIGYIFDATPDADGGLLAAALRFSPTRDIKSSMTLAPIRTCIDGPWVCCHQSSPSILFSTTSSIQGWSFWRVFSSHLQLTPSGQPSWQRTSRPL